VSTLVGVPVKNGGFWLPKFLTDLEQLEDVSRVVFLYGKSDDSTLAILKDYKVGSKHKISIYNEPPLQKAYSAHQIGKIYEDFQELLQNGKESHFLLIDCDITSFPPDLITRLKKHDKDIIAPYVWTHGHVPDKFFDIYCFRVDGCRFHPFNPPQPDKPMQVQSVGSCYLAKRAAFAFTPYGNRPHISFCAKAMEMGFEVWADPTTKIYHVFVEQLGLTRQYPEAMEGLPPDISPFIKNDGSKIPPDQMGPDIFYAYIWKEVR